MSMNLGNLTGFFEYVLAFLEPPLAFFLVDEAGNFVVSEAGDFIVS